MHARCNLEKWNCTEIISLFINDMLHRVPNMLVLLPCGSVSWSVRGTSVSLSRDATSHELADSRATRLIRTRDSLEDIRPANNVDYNRSI
jgi:hypothetical protein